MNEFSKEITSRKKKIWKVLGGFLAMAMVAVISIVGTLAYLSTTSTRKTNTFTATSDIKLDLVEPNFPGGENYQPDAKYPKDPQLVNITGGENGEGEWVAMRVDYMVKKSDQATYSSVSYDDITYNNSDDTPLPANEAKGLIDFKSNKDTELGISTTNTDWIKVDAAYLEDTLKSKVASQKCEYYVYKYQLVEDESVTSGTSSTTVSNGTTGAKTNPLFSSVTIKSQKNLILNGFSMDKLPQFKIDIIGGAIKNLGADVRIDSGTLTVSKLTESGSVDRYIVNQLVALLVDQNPSTTS